MPLRYHNCELRDIMRINTRQLYDLNQVRMDLEDLLFHEPAQRHNIMEKLRIVINKMHEKTRQSPPPDLLYHEPLRCLLRRRSPAQIIVKTSTPTPAKHPQS